MDFRSALGTLVLPVGADLLLRPLQAADLDDIARIMADPEVARWYGPDGAAEVAEILGEPDIWPFLVLRDGRPIGYFQVYHANPDPFWASFGVPAETVGFDMSLGEGRGQGIGSRLTRAMADRMLTFSQIVRVQIDPDPANPRAIQAYAKAGFVAQGVYPGYEHEGAMLYMKIER